MGELIGGRWHRTGIDTVLSEGTLRRPPSVFRDWVKADKDDPFRAEAGRYHIYDAFRSPARSATRKARLAVTGYCGMAGGPPPGRSAARGNRRPAGWRRRPVAHNRSRADRRERRHSSIALTPAVENRRQFSGIQNFGNESRLASDHPVAAPSPRTLRF